MSTRLPHRARSHTRGTELALPVECGVNQALFYVGKWDQAPKEPSVLFKGKWHTPNNFEKVSGKGACKYWKVSIRHHGTPLKHLMNEGILTISPPSCRCQVCQTCAGNVKPVYESSEDDQESSQSTEEEDSDSSLSDFMEDLPLPRKKRRRVSSERSSENDSCHENINGVGESRKGDSCHEHINGGGGSRKGDSCHEHINGGGGSRKDDSCHEHINGEGGLATEKEKEPESTPTPTNSTSSDNLVHILKDMERHFQEDMSLLKSQNAAMDKKLNQILLNKNSIVIQKYEDDLASKDKLIDQLLQRMLCQRVSGQTREWRSGVESSAVPSSGQAIACEPQYSSDKAAAHEIDLSRSSPSCEEVGPVDSGVRDTTSHNSQNMQITVSRGNDGSNQCNIRFKSGAQMVFPFETFTDYTQKVGLLSEFQ